MTRLVVVASVPARPAGEGVLTDEALAFLAELVERFGARVQQLLKAREMRQARIDAGESPGFLAETAAVRAGDWRVAPIPADLLDRRVEITGPTDRKMIVNALNSGARVFMADCEDSMSPGWDNVVAGQANLRDAVRRRIDFTTPEGKAYRLADKPAVLMVRPRGWHLVEKHLEHPDAAFAGIAVPGALVDFGLYLFHNHAELAARGTGPYFYLPKLESHREARLWAEVFDFAERRLGLAHGTVRCTVLIETILAAFEMDEILFELRDHVVGLNCGRWDYIFSFIKKTGLDAAKVLPDRSQVTMDKAFLKAYSLLVIKTCHRRGVHAMGGMAAQIPIKDDPAANSAALEKVRSDKLREVKNGHDGTWVAHPALVPIAMSIFDVHMTGANQIAVKRDDVQVSREDLLAVHEGTKTDAGLRHNIRVGLQYLEAWLRGQGCVPIYNLMEDAATAEISRAQVWQWIKHGASLDNGAVVTEAYFRKALAEETERVKGEVGDKRFASGKFAQASSLFERLSLAPEFIEFLTLPAYDLLLASEAN
jgi:malate synthase A